MINARKKSFFSIKLKVFKNRLLDQLPHLQDLQKPHPNMQLVRCLQ